MDKAKVKNIFPILFSASSMVLLGGCVTQSFENNEPIVKTQANRDEMAATRVSLGLGYLKMGDMSQAKLNLEKARVFAPKLVQVHTAFAHYYETVGESKLAIESFEQALSIKADSADTLNNYGVFLCRQGNVEAAEVQFLKAIAVPSYLLVSQSYENLSSCYLQNDDFEKAEMYLNKAIFHSPNRTGTLLQMVRLQYAMADYKEAKTYLQKFERNTQRFTADSLALSYKLYWKLGQRRTAGNYGNMLVKMYPQSWEGKQFLLNELEFIEADELARKYKLTQRDKKEDLLLSSNKRIVRLSPNSDKNAPHHQVIVTKSVKPTRIDDASAALNVASSTTQGVVEKSTGASNIGAGVISATVSAGANVATAVASTAAIVGASAVVTSSTITAANTPANVDSENTTTSTTANSVAEASEKSTSTDVPRQQSFSATEQATNSSVITAPETAGANLVSTGSSITPIVTTALASKAVATNINKNSSDIETANAALAGVVAKENSVTQSGSIDNTPAYIVENSMSTETVEELAAELQDAEQVTSVESSEFEPTSTQPIAATRDVPLPDAISSEEKVVITKVVSDDALALDTVPEGIVEDAILTADTIAEKTTPELAATGIVTLVDTAPEDVIPELAATGVATPVDTAPEEVIPELAATGVVTPVDTAPEEVIPELAATGVVTPVDTAPEEVIPELASTGTITPVDTAPEEAVSEVMPKEISPKETVTEISDDVLLEETTETTEEDSLKVVELADALHTVEPGQNLYNISVKYNIKIDTLRRWNNIAETNNIRIGDKLYVVNPQIVKDN